ncbi:hypothetical protein HBI31_252800 [Parastagonospora nodorum]|nr:hypothetical protein HBI31_252800 [Parastagonospora nodorum]
MFKQQLDRLFICCPRRDLQRTAMLLIWGVDLSASFDGHFQHLSIASPARPLKHGAERANWAINITTVIH